MELLKVITSLKLSLDRQIILQLIGFKLNYEGTLVDLITIPKLSILVLQNQESKLNSQGFGSRIEPKPSVSIPVWTVSVLV